MPRAKAPRLVVALAAVLGAAGLAADSAAQPAPIEREVERAIEQLHAAKGPEAYAALRELWRTWDRADPAHVEEALASAAADKATPAPVRVYAELLTAYARRRRGDLDGSVARIAKLGFVTTWLGVGPFENENKVGFTRAFGPDADLGEPVSLSRSYDGKERAVRWRAPPEASVYGWFDFGAMLRPREHVCAYATTFVRAKQGTRAPRPVSLWVGTAGSFRLYYNGEKVLEDSAYRQLDIDRFATTVRLGTGFNRITVKVCGDDEAPKFALRIGDEHGAPDLGVEAKIDLDVVQSGAGDKAGARAPNVPGTKAKETPAARADKAAKPGSGAPARPDDKSSAETPPPAPRGAALGPVQQFERLTSGAKPSPQNLEAYARYLAVTGGDSKTEHKARDLARRASEADPTVRRLLLAGQLAEDKNQQREWIERASAKAGPKHKDIEVLLAEAQLAQGSVNWRDAVPIYERILAIDPTNTQGILGRADLYVEAGLKRTAAKTLEAAVMAQPMSVSLLRAYALQLRALGRETEAAEAEARYASLRFDDSSFLSEQVELAVARRDIAGAERWLGRFLRSEPDTTFAQTVAARTYRALGQTARAIASYKEALAMAPEDLQVLRALSDLYGEDENREEQLKLLRQILAIHPQAKDVREYVEHIEPPKPRSDEAYAWAPERFLPMRGATAGTRYPRRTLRNLTVTSVFPNGLASRFRQIVFQPLTDEAAAKGREYAFDYEAAKQTVVLRAAKVYRADGKIDEAIESGEAPENNPAIAMYTSQRTFYVHFPRLNAGDIVELRYRVEDVAPRNEIADYFGEIEFLQSDEPIASSEYVLLTPKARTFFTYASPLPGLKREVSESGEQRIYRFTATNVPPMTVEPSMPPWAEALAHVHVSTFKTWDEVGAWYWGLARDQFDVDDEVRKVAREITKGATDVRSKVRAVYKYATSLRYVALEFGIEGIRPRRCAQTVARGWGDCKDKATLIVTLLRELGIPSTVVLVRTGLRGDVEASPASLAPFDHAIAYVPSLDLYLDGTAEHTGTTELPPFDRGAVGLQINEGKPKLVRLPEPPPEESVAKRHVDVTLAQDGSAQIGVDVQVTGAFAPSWRIRYLAEGTRRDRAARDLATYFGPVELAAGKAGVEVNDLEQVEQPVKLRYRGKASAFARKDGDTMSFLSAPAPQLTAEYASLSTRTSDLRMNALTSREEEWVFHLPAGAKATTLPTADQKDTPFGRYAVSVEQAPGKIVVRTSLAFKKSRITPAEYGGWRAFCEAVDRSFGQRIVVAK